MEGFWLNPHHSGNLKKIFIVDNVLQEVQTVEINHTSLLKYSLNNLIKQTPSGNYLKCPLNNFGIIYNEGTDKFWDFCYCLLNKGMSA